MHKNKHNRQFKKYLHSDKLIRFIDKFIYLVGIFSISMTFPQIIKVWSEDASGVSMWSWGTYAFCNIMWLIHGFIHKETALAFVSALRFTATFLVFLGTFIYLT